MPRRLQKVLKPKVVTHLINETNCMLIIINNNNNNIIIIIIIINNNFI